MECRKLQITLISANDLPNIRQLGVMKVYATVFLKGSESKTSKKTPVDMQGETNPNWNFPIKYTLSESTVEKPGQDLVVKLYCKRTLGDKIIGTVNIPVKGLFDKGLKSEAVLSYGVAGTEDGILNIMYSFGEKIWLQRETGTASKAGSGREKIDSGSMKSALELGFMVLVRGAMILLDIFEDQYYDDDHDHGHSFSGAYFYQDGDDDDDDYDHYEDDDDYYDDDDDDVFSD